MTAPSSPVVADRAATGQDDPTGRAQGEGTEPVGIVPGLEIHVLGTPAPQGSKKGYVANGRAIIVDDNKPRLRSWRSDVKEAATGATELHALPGRWTPLTGEVEVDVTFLIGRPKGHYRTGRNAHLLRDSAPTRPTTKPDVDKLLRGVLDALGAAGVYRDDSQVVTLTGRKVYAGHEAGLPGARIRIYHGGVA